ncbi:MAG TPA: TolC family protein [Bryobacteraceae bacterium]|nr:TolC family protein [Bryobacteraceae bacterium]
MTSRMWNRKPVVLALFAVLFAGSAIGQASGADSQRSAGLADAGLRSVGQPVRNWNEAVPGLAGMTEIGLQSPGAATAGPRHLTLAQAQQQASRSYNPMARLGLLSVEAARQHRLGVQADYFPKIGATFANLHFNKFMGDRITVQRPIVGTAVTAAVPLLGQNQTLAGVIVTQPITPLFKVHEAVNLARADERIARAKAGVAVAGISTAVEKTYYALLVAQRQMELAEANARRENGGLMLASTAAAAMAPANDPVETLQANKALVEASGKVKELTVALNQLLGWPADTRLQLEIPAPLVENLRFQEVSNQSVANNPDIVEAEQNVAKAKAASRLSKLDYVPDVAGMWGYFYNGNILPLLPRDFSFVGVVASYNIFDFGKREHSVKERRAQVEMAETALELTKAKVGASIQQSYYELERTRRLSAVAQQMESAIRAIEVKYNPDDSDWKASRAKVEIEALQADLEHRQAYAKMKSLLGDQDIR